jgi:hypothetical protein
MYRKYRISDWETTLAKETPMSRKRDPRMRWAVTANHVYPVDDLRDHEPENCWCGPYEDHGLVIHKSLDGRELYERGERKLS